MIDNSLSEIGINLLSILGDLILTGVCIYYVVKSNSIDGILLLISSAMSLLTRPMYYFVFKYILSSETYGSGKFSMINSLLGLFGIISQIIFIIGFILLVIKQINSCNAKEKKDFS